MKWHNFLYFLVKMLPKPSCKSAPFEDTSILWKIALWVHGVGNEELQAFIWATVFLQFSQYDIWLLLYRLDTPYVHLIWIKKLFYFTICTVTVAPAQISLNFASNNWMRTWVWIILLLKIITSLSFLVMEWYYSTYFEEQSCPSAASFMKF